MDGIEHRSNIISIHALLTESDVYYPVGGHADQRISIHALLTESDYVGFGGIIKAKQFQSTLSSRRATSSEGTSLWTKKNFNPRSPHGERPPMF